jgi:glucokinase
MRVLDATDAMPGWAGTEFGVLLGGRFGLPVAAANDVHCALLGEMARNPLLAGVRGTVVMLAVGTGLGGAVAVDGRLAAGRHGLAGHFGRSLGRDPLDGSAATYDALASGSALARFYRRLAPGRPVWAGDAVMRLAADGEAQARAALDAWLDALALLLHNLYWGLDPELVLLGGGVLDSRALWWDDLQARLRAQGVAPALAPASLGNAAALHGAAHLVLGAA